MIVLSFIFTNNEAKHLLLMYEWKMYIWPSPCTILNIPSARMTPVLARHVKPDVVPNMIMLSDSLANIIGCLSSCCTSCWNVVGIRSFLFISFFKYFESAETVVGSTSVGFKFEFSNNFNPFSKSFFIFNTFLSSPFLWHDLCVATLVTSVIFLCTLL